jgi:hypothetical protein
VPARSQHWYGNSVAYAARRFLTPEPLGVKVHPVADLTVPPWPPDPIL